MYLDVYCGSCSVYLLGGAENFNMFPVICLNDFCQKISFIARGYQLDPGPKSHISD